MIKRIFAIAFIYICTVIAWFILGETVNVRTRTQDQDLKKAVGRLWGTVQQQESPEIYYRQLRADALSPAKAGIKASADIGRIEKTEPVPLEGSDLEADINLDYRKKGLLWYSTYQVKFSGIYRVANDSYLTRDFVFVFKLPDQNAVYDNFRLSVGSRDVKDLNIEQGVLRENMTIAPGQTQTILVSYSTRGMDAWWYNFGSNVAQVKNFNLTMRTNFDRIDFPGEGISPAARERNGHGWTLKWQYKNLLSGVRIGMAMPKKLNPGPWVKKVIYFAPVSLFLFFFLLIIFTTLKQVRVHPINYFFIGCSFFSYHLLLAYLVDHVSIHIAFWVCSAVSIFLSVSYMKLVTGGKFALLDVGVSQFVYLTLFSYTFFFQGYTGLAVTIMCIITLFIVMQLTGRIDWGKMNAGDEQVQVTRLIPDNMMPKGEEIGDTPINLG